MMEVYAYEAERESAGGRACTRSSILPPASAAHWQTAVRLALPGELGRHAVEEGKRAVLRFSGHKS